MKYGILLAILIFVFLVQAPSIFAGGGDRSYKTISDNASQTVPLNNPPENIQEITPVMGKANYVLSDNPRQVGQLLSWQNLLQIVGVLFAAVQFMEGAKLRNYIFRWGFLLSLTAWTIGTSVILVAISNLITLTQMQIPLVSSPPAYELLALVILSVLIIAYVVFLLKPKWFLPRFGKKLLNNIHGELLNNLSDENMGAISRILGAYLEDLIKKASKSERQYPNIQPRKLSKEDEEARDIISFIDIDMSSPKFASYLAKNNIHFVMTYIQLAEGHRLYEAGGHIFMDNLCKVLFTDEESLLSKELSVGGVSGAYEPLSNLLFNSPGIVATYRIFQSFNHYSTNISDTTLTNWTKGLEFALKNYFSKIQNTNYWDTPNTALGVALTNLTSCLQHLIIKISKVPNDAIWDNDLSSKLHIITRFFNDLESVLVQDNPEEEYKPTFSEAELIAEKDTVSEWISKACFEYLEAFALLDSQDYARTMAIEPMWLIYHDEGVPIFDAIRGKVRDLIKERFEENYRGHYHSMIKFLLYVYGGQVKAGQKRDNSIISYVCDEFNNNIAEKLIKDIDFQKENLPTNWKVEGKAIYWTIYGKKEMLFEYKSS